MSKNNRASVDNRNESLRRVCLYVFCAKRDAAQIVRKHRLLKRRFETIANVFPSAVAEIRSVLTKMQKCFDILFNDFGMHSSRCHCRCSLHVICTLSLSLSFFLSACHYLGLPLSLCLFLSLGLPLSLSLSVSCLRKGDVWAWGGGACGETISASPCPPLPPALLTRVPTSLTGSPSS